MVRPRQGFRLQAVRIYLTYPQCDTTKEVVLQRAKDRWGEELRWIVIGQENHADGNLHLHIAICFVRKKDFQSASYLDFLTMTHGNYQAMKKMRECLEYCTKDGNYLEEGICAADWLMAQQPVSARIAKAVADGKDLEEVHSEFPSYMVRNLRQVEYYISWRKRMRTQMREPEWDGVMCARDAPHPTHAIVAWLNRNILSPRIHKQRQLWIWGPPNVGKSSLLLLLSTWLRVLWMPKEENYYDLWEDNVYDLMVIDEFRGQKKLTWMNEVLEGVPLVMPFKGGQRMKTQNIPIIICSNGTPNQSYSKVDVQWLAPLEARLKVVEVTEFIMIHGK